MSKSAEESPKKQKKIDTNVDQQVAGPSNVIQTADVFKLNVDCLDKIFDYLSLKDLHSIGGTCKAMQQVAGEYFKLNFPAAPKYTEKDGIYTEYSDMNGVTNQRIQTSGFNQFINYLSHYYQRMSPLNYIESHSHELESLNHIYLVCACLDQQKVRRIQKLLRRIEILQIRNCSMQVEFYPSILKMCDNLKELLLQEADVGRYRRDAWENQWLRQTYPKLEYLELIPQYEYRIEELVPFFQQNPNVRSFSSSSRCLLANATDLLKSDVKLDLLEVKVFQIPRFYYDDEDDEEITHLKSIRELLHQLHERGFYNRLHLYVQRINQQCSDQLSLLRGLEKLCIKYFTEICNLSHLISLKELVILNDAKSADMEILANNLTNLQRLFLQNATFNDLLPFIRHSMKLRVVKFFPKESEDKEDGTEALKIITLERERLKLMTARKVTIYVPDDIFLATKWTLNYGDTNMNSVEMKRTHSYSYRWDLAIF